MTWRALKAVVVVVACVLTVNHLEDLARFLHIRDLSNPNRYPPAARSARPAGGT